MREVLAVRVVPARRDLAAVRDELAPEVLVRVVPRLAEPVDGREEERRAGRRRVRVLGHRERRVRLVGDILQVCREGQVVRREPRHIVVELHVAVVERRRDLLAVHAEGRSQLVGHAGERGARVRLEDAVGLRAVDERVVDAEHHVRDGLVLRDDGLRERFARVARLHERDGPAGLVREVGEVVLRGTVRGVREDRHGAAAVRGRRRVRGRRARGRAAGRRRRRGGRARGGRVGGAAGEDRRGEENGGKEGEAHDIPWS